MSDIPLGSVREQLIVGFIQTAQLKVKYVYGKKRIPNAKVYLFHDKG